MKHYGKLFIDGSWVEPSTDTRRELVNPLTEEVFATVCVGDVEDVNRAVAAARRAFDYSAKTSVAERLALIDRIIATYEARLDDFSSIIAEEAGIPKSARAQVTGPVEHMKVARSLIASYPFESQLADTIIRREPIGVCALIAPWNWPIQTGLIKIIYALAAGCTMVFKPSDASPVCAIILAEVLEEAGVPAGVFNLVLGKGSIIGAAMANHAGVDMVSFTGSTQAGIKVAQAAARTLKKTALELGGKSANIVLKDANLEQAARWNIQRCFMNSGQSCHAPSRMLVHESQIEDVIAYLADEVAKYRLGDPGDMRTTMGPLVNATQFKSVQDYIQIGIDEGARPVVGGIGRPDGLNRGFFVRPTVFVDVTPQMTIAREEIFGPVLAVLPYKSEEEALDIANDTPFGLGGYVFSNDRKRGYEFASGLRAGRVSFNGAPTNSWTPMGGYKQSGLGREMGVFGLEEYLETKSVYGFKEEAAQLPSRMRDF